MEFEELAVFRQQLLKIKEEKGIKGVKDFSRQLKKERRWKPKTILELKSSTYGIPDAGQAFVMFMQGLHIKNVDLPNLRLTQRFTSGSAKNLQSQNKKAK